MLVEGLGWMNRQSPPKCPSSADPARQGHIQTFLEISTDAWCLSPKLKPLAQTGEHSDLQGVFTCVPHDVAS